ncbi:MAG: SGNH/GDSL hydrolase family protein [Gemmatimonadetes bacterium]|nr:SGNH/GDSL hydrolase family protein [Gemmatimonadota bacterium]
MQIKRLVSTLLVALPVLAGCRTDEKLNAPDVLDPIFQRYVSMGNSITAGYMSAGINDSTQKRSYAVLLGAAMGTSFNYPRLNGRGCAPPFTNNVTQARVGGGTSTTCDLRVPLEGTLNNTAVPGARVQELLSNFGVPASSSNALTTFFLGGKTQIQRMTEAQPTFVTVWIGNNDVLGSLTSSANPGNPALVTPLNTFTAQYDSVLDAIEATGARAALVTVGDVSVIPYASKGAIWYCLKNGGCPAPLPPQDPTLAGIPTFTVNVSCAPVPPAGGGLSILVPWTVGLTKLSTAIAGFPATIDCSVDNEVVTSAELTGLVTAVQGFNAHIVAEGAARGMAVFDINPTLGALVGNAIPSFPDISGAAVGQPVTFGTMFTLDGVHPSALAHQVVADSLAAVINRTYGTSLPVPVCGTVSCPAP